MSMMSGDSAENVEAIASANGIKPLVALLDSTDPETQRHAATVLADMTEGNAQHGVAVAREGVCGMQT